MLPLSAYMWRVAFCITTVATIGVKICSLDDEAEFDNCCTLGTDYHSCEMSCQIQVEGEEENRVGELSTCLDGQSQKMTCFKGKWVTAGKSLLRRKRWWGRRRRRRAPVVQHNPTIHCPRNFNVKAPAGKRSARASWSRPSASDPNGDTPSVTQTEGLASGSMFPEGPTPIRYTARDNTGRTATCIFIVTVTVTYCSTSQRQAFGSSTPFFSLLPSVTYCSTSQRQAFGSSTPFFSLFPSVTYCSTSQRQAFGSSTPFFSLFPSVTYCSNSQKQAFGSPGTQTCQGAKASNIYGSTCQHSCPTTGYTLQGQASVYCQSNGQWNGAFPRCQIVSCGKPADVAAGQVSCPSGYTYNRQCVLQCQNGFISSHIAIICGSSGQWTSTLQPCLADLSLFSGPLRTPVEVTWPGPVVTDNGPDPVTLSSDPAKGSRLGVGRHTVRVTAVDGARNTANCSFLVNIVAKECPLLLPPTNGHVSCTSGHVEGSKCTFDCSMGYRVQGHSSLTCLGSGQWNRTAPKCEDKTVPRFPNGCPADLSLFSGPLRTPVEVTWPGPVVTDNGPDPVTLSSDPAKGSRLGVGRHTVRVTAVDGARNTANCSFLVNIVENRHVNYHETKKEPDDTGSESKTDCGVNASYLPDARVDQQSSANEAKECPLLLPPTNGHVSCTSGHVEGSKCTFDCSMGYRVQGHSSLTCLGSGQWNRTAPKCEDKTVPRFPNGCPADLSLFSGPLRTPVEVTWPGPVVTDNGPDPVTLSSDPAKGSRLGVGRHTVRVTAVDGARNTANCSFLVNIVAKECPLLLPPTNGHVSCTSGHVEGSKCTFDCSTGYRVQGHSSLTCLGSGQWNRTAPKCEVVSCGKPADVAAGQVSCPSGYTYNRQCVLQCQNGFISSHIAIICGSSGQWTSTLQPCLADLSLFSGPLRTPVEVTWPGPVVTDNGPDPVTLSSDPAKGSRLGVGRHTVRVTAVDGARNTANCSFLVNIVAKECPLLLPPTNGHVSCTSGHVEGSKCTFDCSMGYRVQGHSSLTCLGSGQWNRTAPKCEDKTVPRFPNGCPADLSLFSGPLRTPVEVTWPGPVVTDNGPDPVTLSSDPAKGSRLGVGRHTVRVTAVDGARNTANCSFLVNIVAKECPLLLPPTNGHVSCTSGHVEGSKCTFDCSMGYRVQGHSSLTCLGSGQWNRTAPKCEADLSLFSGPLRTPVEVTWPGPVVTDNGPDPVTLSSDPAKGSRLGVGRHTVRVTAVDGARNTANCSFLVNIVENRHVNYHETKKEPDDTGSESKTDCGVNASYLPDARVDQQSSANEAKECPLLLPPTNGHVSCTSGHVEGSKCTFDCSMGYRVQGHSSLTCLGSGQWNRTAPKCEDKTVPRFPNGCPADLSLFSGPLRTPVEVTWPGPVVTDNGPDPVTLSSDPAKGSRLGVGRHTVRVTAVDGARNTANCSFLVNIVAKECPLLLPPTNGHVSCTSGHVEGSKCTFDCSMGYRVQGHSSLTCLGSGQWNRTAPKCEADLSLFSGPLRTPVEVTWPGPVVTDNGPDPVTLSSDPAKGSRLGVGRHTVRVTAVDGARNTANCSFLVNIVAKECPLLLPPTNGHVSCTSGHVEGSKCTFDCSTGYRVQGHSSLTCLGSGQWNRTAPKCEALMCPARPEVEKGSFLCPQGHQFPAECTLTCESGYNITGSKTIKCQENETWTQHGSCRDIEPPRFVSCPSDVHSYASRLGSETRVSWTPLQASDNSGNSIHVTCDSTSGSAFLPGTTAVTCTTSDAAGNSRNCKFSVNVTVLLCPNPGTFLNNQSEMLFTCSDGHVHGAKCMLGCSQDNSLLGEDQIVCERRANTNPPQMRWTGTKGELTSQPKCKVDKCPRLEPPKHGSLSCMRGLLAQDCFMACHSGYDVSARYLRFDGYFFCNGRTGVWTGLPSNGVPQCVVRKTPWRVQIYSHLFYLTDACNGSESTIRDNFITRLTSSDILKDACAVPTCVARNVKVTCGPVTEARRRRTVDQRFDPRRPQKTGGKGSDVASHQIVVSFEVTLSDLLANTSLSDSQLFRAVHQTRDSLTQTLTVLAASGRLMNPRHVQPANIIGVGRRPSLHVHCPPGTLLRPLDLSPDRFSCVGCSKGHYLPPDTTQCWLCPRGQFSPLDSATSCMPCPLGMTTVSSGATDPSLCLPSPPAP
ncbi:hypothetical protein ACOMHN_008434 [Nucella lapillus]